MKRKKLTTIVAIALALVMICGGIAIYAAGDAKEKRIGGEDTAKVTPEASIEPEAKITPEPEAVEGEESDEQLWKLQLADTPAYLGVSVMDRSSFDGYSGCPGIQDAELIAEFTEMLNGIRMTKITNEEYSRYLDEEKQNSGFDDTSVGQFCLYNAEGRYLGTITLQRFATSAVGAEYYPKDNPGWSKMVFVCTKDTTDLQEFADNIECFMIDESTFDEDLIERIWKECLCGAIPYDFIHNTDAVASGNDPYGRKPMDLLSVNAISNYEIEHPNEFDDVIAVPVD